MPTCIVMWSWETFTSKDLNKYGITNFVANCPYIGGYSVTDVNAKQSPIMICTVEKIIHAEGNT